MLGNAAEFTSDCWFEGHEIEIGKVGGIDLKGSPVLDGPNVDCDHGAVRGGSFASNAGTATVWYRRKIRTRSSTGTMPVPEYGYFDVGFRVKREP